MPHIHEKIDFTVEVFIVFNNKVLLRKHDKYKIWLGVGGHIELDEDPIEAALREVKEEVGLDVNIIGNSNVSNVLGNGELIPPRFLNRHKISEEHEHIALVYFALTDNDKLVVSEIEKTDECRWFNKEDLDSNDFDIRDNIKYYAKEALETLKNK